MIESYVAIALCVLIFLVFTIGACAIKYSFDLMFDDNFISAKKEEVDNDLGNK